MSDYVWTPYQEVALELEAQDLIEPDVRDEDLENFDWEDEDVESSG